MNPVKGTYGYRKAKTRQRIMILIALAFAIIIQLSLRSSTPDLNLRTILTVSSIITVLPFATIASPLASGFRYTTFDRALYEKTIPYEKDFPIIYDLLLTTKTQIVPLDIVVIHANGVYGYSSMGHTFNIEKAQKALNEILAENHLEPNLKIFREEKSLFKRMDSLKQLNVKGDKEVLKYTAETIKNLTM